MNLRRRQKEHAEVSTESLNDIMFFLLLFFLIISTLVNPSVIKLNLPNSVNNEQVQVNTIQLQVNKDLQYHIDNRPVSFGDLEQVLMTEIKQKTNEAGAPTVALHLDKDLKIQDLVDVMQLGARLKVKMVLATKKSPNS